MHGGDPDRVYVMGQSAGATARRGLRRSRVRQPGRAGAGIGMEAGGRATDLRQVRHGHDGAREARSMRTSVTDESKLRERFVPCGAGGIERAAVRRGRGVRSAGLPEAVRRCCWRRTCAVRCRCRDSCSSWHNNHFTTVWRLGLEEDALGPYIRELVGLSADEAGLRFPAEDLRSAARRAACSRASPARTRASRLPCTCS